MFSPLTPEITSALEIAPSLKARDLAVYTSPSGLTTYGVRVLEIKTDGSLAVMVLDKGADFGMKFLADASQVRGGI